MKYKADSNDRTQWLPFKFNGNTFGYSCEFILWNLFTKIIIIIISLALGQ